MKPSNNDLFWLAGLLEGEGTFHLQRGKYIHMAFSSIDKDVVERVAALWNSGIGHSFTQANKKIYKTTLTGRRAKPWLELLKPLMGIRRQTQIAVCLGEIG